MKKQLLTIALACISIYSKAQTDPAPKIIGDTLFTTCGYKIVEGEKIKIGTGSMPDGDFKFIRINSASIFRNFATSPGNNSRENAANALPRSQSGFNYKVTKIMERGNKKHGYIYYVKIVSGVTAYEIDVENAIASGELSIPDYFKKQKNTESKSPVASTTDELIKLKKLLDDGAITKEEYDVQKKKILNQ